MSHNKHSLIFITALSILCGTNLPFAHAKTTPENTLSSPRVMSSRQISTQKAEEIYSTMLGELSIVSGDYQQALTHLLRAAQLSSDDQLFERAIALATQNKDYNSVLQIATAWLKANPNARDAHFFTLNALIEQKKFDQIAPAIQGMFYTAPDEERPEIIAAMGQYLSPYATEIEPNYLFWLEPWLEGDNTTEAAAAWISVGLVRLNAQKTQEAYQAVLNAYALDPQAMEAPLFAIDFLTQPQLNSETLILDYLQKPYADTKVRFAYIQFLLQHQRIADAIQQLEIATTKSDAPDIAWFLLGSLYLETQQHQAGLKTLKIYLDKSANDSSAETLNNRERIYLELAQAEIDLGQISQAQQWIDRVSDPAIRLTAQQAYIQMLLGAKQYDMALAAIEKLPANNNQDLILKQILHAQVLLQAQRWSQAYNYLKQANASTLIDDRDLLYLQAIAAFELGRFTEAQSLLQRLITSDSTNAQALNALGYLLTTQNQRLPEAAQYIQTALEQDPQNPAYLDSFGWVTFKQGNTQAALPYLEQAYALSPDAETSAHLGEVLWTLGQREQALIIWKLALLDNPDNKKLLNTFKRLNVPLSAVRNAIIPTQSTDTASPQNTSAGTISGIAMLEHLLENKEWQKLYDLLSMTNTQSSHPTLLQIQATAAEQLGKLEEAESLYRQIIQQTPDDAMIYNNFAYMFIERGIRLDEARELVEYADTLQPNDPYILDSRGWLEFQENNIEQAIILLRQAYTLDPDILENGIHLGEALWVFGSKAQAYLIWKDIDFRFPNNPQLQQTLKRLRVTLP